MAHRALTPKLLDELRLAPSDGDVSASTERESENPRGVESVGVAET